MRLLARSGIATVGLLHIMIGLIALGLATGRGSGEADQSGAIAQISRIPGGIVLVWIVLIGMLALFGWQVLTALLANESDFRSRWGFRIVELGKAVGYLVIAATAFTFARGSSTSTAELTSGMSAALIKTPVGAVLLVVIGIVVLIVGISFVVSGVTGRFTEAIRVPRGLPGFVTTALGSIGYVAKGLVLSVAGVLFARAPFALDPESASGIHGALKILVELPYGAIALAVAGIGLIAYGLFFIVRARLVEM